MGKHTEEFNSIINERGMEEPTHDNDETKSISYE